MGKDARRVRRHVVGENEGSFYRRAGERCGSVVRYDATRRCRRRGGRRWLTSDHMQPVSPPANGRKRRVDSGIGRVSAARRDAASTCNDSNSGAWGGGGGGGSHEVAPSADGGRGRVTISDNCQGRESVSDGIMDQRRAAHHGRVHRGEHQSRAAAVGGGILGDARALPLQCGADGIRDRINGCPRQIGRGGRPPRVPSPYPRPAARRSPDMSTAAQSVTPAARDTEKYRTVNSPYQSLSRGTCNIFKHNEPNVINQMVRVPKIRHRGFFFLGPLAFYSGPIM